MRILFAYFDFSTKSEVNDVRPLGECAINLSTSHNYYVNKKPNIGTENPTEYSYLISRSKKPSDECIPAGFWGERIYNVTAVVGDNGVGKSTILHNIIKVVVNGMHPDLPFLIVLEETGSKVLHLYCSDHRFELAEKWEEQVTLGTEYPSCLMNAKAMLLDNTLSYSAIELDSKFGDMAYDDITMFEGYTNLPAPIPEDRKQFFNKSLVASIRYSNAMSLAGRSVPYLPVRELLISHFNYETYQEARFLFDRYQQKNLSTLNDGSFSVPTPNYLLVTVMSVSEMNQRDNDMEVVSVNPFTGVPYGVLSLETLQNSGFIGAILADAFYNLCALTVDTRKRILELLEEAIVGEKPLERNIDEYSDTAVQIAQIVMDGIELSDDICRYPYQEKPINDIRRFIEYVTNNEETLRDIFEPIKSTDSPSLSFRIDIKRTVSNEEKRRCMIDFLDNYRLASDSQYFLVFSSGMSSGEKNFIKMMTQFDYALSGPSVYEEGATADNTGRRLVNGIGKEERACDTLFLFLDEADLTYHPKWQRVFVSKLMTILPLMFRDPYNSESNDTSGCKDIQVVLATHSPLMLGDFPKACVNYLMRDDGLAIGAKRLPPHSSFGENLYNILRDSYFLDNAIGEFALEKINAAVRWCDAVDEAGGSTAQEIQKEYETHRHTAELLPRGVIRSKLMSELERRRVELDLDFPEHLANNTEIKLDEVLKRNSELQRKLDKANEILRKAGLLNE